jgi:RNA polymerase sigma-70 factor (ECF subfamily)
MAAWPQVALAEVRRLERDGRLAGYQYLPAVKADLLAQQAGMPRRPRPTGKPLKLTPNEAERGFLAERLAAVIQPAGK